jgi:hypothetical protein
MSEEAKYWRVEFRSVVGHWLLQSEVQESFEIACEMAQRVSGDMRRDTRVVEVREQHKAVKHYPKPSAILAGKEQG